VSTFCTVYLITRNENRYFATRSNALYPHEVTATDSMSASPSLPMAHQRV
jgi:hypothetical protein